MNDDLISRSKLRKRFQAILDRGDMFCEYDIIGMVDNEPPVESPEQITIKCDTEEDRQKLLSVFKNAKVTGFVECERPQGDLISRKALKEAIRKRLGISSLKYLTEQERVVVEEIDNVQTVPNEYMRGYEAAEREYKRPQGEWITDERGYVCSECGALHSDDYPFCHMCGADMRKEASDV